MTTMCWDEIAERTPVGLLVVSAGKVLRANPTAVSLVESHGASWAAGAGALEGVLAVPPDTGHATVRWPSPTGGTRWWDVLGVRSDDADLLYVIVDQTAEYSSDAPSLGHRTAQWRLDRLEALTGSGSWGFGIRDSSFTWSAGLRALYGVPPGERAPDYAAFVAMLDPAERQAMCEAVAAAIATMTPFSFTHRYRPREGASERVLECVGEVFADATGEPNRILAAVHDITDADRARAELAYLADHDPLTGVANRRRITARLAECAARPGGAALLLLDIDNFKDVNDIRGHVVGDRVIRKIARTMEARLPADALLGRLGGDEFAVLLPAADVGAAAELAEDLCDLVSRTPVVDGADAIRITASVGVAVVGGEVDVETGLAHADLALYEAKRTGRNRVRLFSPGQYHEAMQRVSVLQRVAAALDEGTMGLDAQPIVDLATGRSYRQEVLIRLRDRRGPPLGPAEFLPAAERTDLVLRIDRWVLSRSIEVLATPKARASGLCLEVNVSARSLDDPDLGHWIIDQLKLAEVDPRRLGLEITETAAISSMEAARALAVQVSEAGCGFTLDDFGAGFASFSHLKNLPFTAVKIAGEFVRQVDEDPVDRALITAVVGVARELGMRTVAEHVDRRPMVERLRALGVDDGQGFLLGRPHHLTS